MEDIRPRVKSFTNVSAPRTDNVTQSMPEPTVWPRAPAAVVAAAPPAAPVAAPPAAPTIAARLRVAPAAAVAVSRSFVNEHAALLIIAAVIVIVVVVVVWWRRPAPPAAAALLAPYRPDPGAKRNSVLSDTTAEEMARYAALAPLPKAVVAVEPFVPTADASADSEPSTIEIVVEPVDAEPVMVAVPVMAEPVVHNATLSAARDEPSNEAAVSSVISMLPLPMAVSMAPADAALLASDDIIHVDQLHMKTGAFVREYRSRSELERDGYTYARVMECTAKSSSTHRNARWRLGA